MMSHLRSSRAIAVDPRTTSNISPLKQSGITRKQALASYTRENASPQEKLVSKIVSESVTEAFYHLGPKHVVECLIDILELEHSVTLASIASNPCNFKKAIESMFGEGSYFIDKLIRARLGKKLGLDYEGKTLEDLIAAAASSSSSSSSSSLLN